MSASPSWMNWLPQANSALRMGSSLAGSNNGALSSVGGYAGDAGNALGVLGGLQRGGVGGDTSAAINAAKLGSSTGVFGSNTSDVNQGVGYLGDTLGIYQGLDKGGVSGYGSAAINAAKLGTQAGAFGGTSGALGQAAGYAAIPLDLYNEINNWKSGSTGSDALSGAETGAAIGSVVPVVGTALGAIIGGVGGALSSAFGPGAKDPETADVQNVINATSANQNNPGVAASVQNPYLQLAGLMDERSSTLPEYQQYGRMGEQAFTDDMTKQINSALASGQISKSTSGADVYDQVVAPWVNKMGSGYSSVGAAYDATNQGLIEDMTNEYMSGNAAQDWKSVGGQSPFSNIYAGSPFASAAATPTQENSPMAQNAGLNRTMKAADGGAISAKLRKLYAGSFANRKQHYDDGGGVDYFTPSYTDMTKEQDPTVASWALPTTQAGLSSNLGQTGLQSLGNGSNVSETSQASDSLNNSSLSPGGALGGLGSLLGVSSMGQLVKQYGALAPLLTGLLGQNKPATAPATPAGYGAIPSIATPTNTRSYTQPNVANWYTYGQGPEQSFFSNNQLPTVPGVSPSNATPSAPTTSAAPNVGIQPVNNTPTNTGGRLQMPVMADGGSFDSTQGDDYVADPGHGDGTSDGIDAKLSGGEYVMDAGTVAILGNGSNGAGARALDKLRQRVRKHAGKQLVKGKQFMKAKQPQAYLSGSGAG